MIPPTNIHKIPFSFDTTILREEVAKIDATDWHSHAVEAAGNQTIVLTSVGGTINHDYAISGPIEATVFLDRFPYIKQVLQAFDLPVSRCRLVKIPGKTQIPAQVYHCYHWYRRHAIYIPIVTHEGLELFYDGKSRVINAGEAWSLDPAIPHWMHNQSESECVHLIIEMKNPPQPSQNKIKHIPYQQGLGHVLTEDYSFEVFSPAEIHQLTAEIYQQLENAAVPPKTYAELTHHINYFRTRWGEVFSRFGHHSAGELSYQDLLLYFKEQVALKGRKYLLRANWDKMNVIELINSMLLTSARPTPMRFIKRLLAKNNEKRVPLPNLEPLKGHRPSPKFQKPIFIISTPRAGSSLLFETLSKFSDLWTIGVESHETIEGIPELHPASHEFKSNRLTAEDLQPHIASRLIGRFTGQLKNREGQAYSDLPVEEFVRPIRFLEKTPKNALRIPFLKALFPDALFLFLYRDPKENISSLIEGWRSRRFLAYDPLPGWTHTGWSFLLPPGWATLQDSSIAEICAYQWEKTNAIVMEDLRSMTDQSWHVISYLDLVQDPKQVIAGISQFAGLQWDEKIKQVVSQALPVSHLTLSNPMADKWRKNKREIDSILSKVEPRFQALEELKQGRLRS